MKKRLFNELTIVYGDNSSYSKKFLINKCLKDLIGRVYFVNSNNKLNGYFDILTMLDNEQNNYDDYDIPINTVNNAVNFSKNEWYGNVIRQRNSIDEGFKNSIADISCAALPIIDSNNILSGDISFLDEYIDFCRRNIAVLNAIGQFISNSVYVIRPRFVELYEIYTLFIKKLHSYSIKFTEINLSELDNLDLNNSLLVFSSYQDLQYFKIQKRAVKSVNLYCIKTFIDYILRLHKKSVLGKLLANVGVKTYTFNFTIPYDIEDVSYIKNYKTEMNNRKTICVGDDRVIPKQLSKKFLGDLYTDDYWNFFKGRKYPQYKKNGITYLRDITSPYLNIVNGRRKVSFQENLVSACNNIYFFGRCTFVGSRVEDKNTIPSIVQKLLNNDNIAYKVLNESSWDDENGRIWKILNHSYESGDIVVIHGMSDVYGSVDINGARLAYNNNISLDCFTDNFAHANHIALKCYADGIYTKIKPSLNIVDNNYSQSKNKISIKKEYIKSVYIDRYFSNFNFSENETIGCIVMNCNPFTLGHRYLIEKAASRVNKLIIFVVEENKSYFSFQDRLSMVEYGVSHLENVIVVPSGDFILSSSTFPEYFMKIMDDDISVNVDFDITLFAECIAEPLGIKFRFVGQELTDVVTNEYNQAMHKILPLYGIEVVEIERLATDDNIISASLVRKYLEFNLYDKLSKFIPQTTMSYLFINSNSNSNSSCNCNQYSSNFPASAFIIYSFISDDYYCKVYSDGSCEQSGSILVASEILPGKSLSFDVLLLKEYFNDKYAVNISISFLTEYQKCSSGEEINIYSKHKKSFKIFYYNRNGKIPTSPNFVIHWHSIGRMW